MRPRAIILGPQRHVHGVRAAVDEVCPRDGVTALVSAGWEEREPEDAEFREHLRRPVVNLEVWARVERIFEQDPELLTAMRQRQDTLRRVQELYRLRLGGLLQPALELMRAVGDAALLDPERDDAVAMLRELDRGHAARIAAIHAGFVERWRPAERDAVARHRRELDELLAGASCLCIAGGHVAVLLHRLQLFDLPRTWGARPVIAWSAGAMALGERVVLFHQEHGHGADVQVMEDGFGAVPGLVPLPHARKRLDLRDRHNIALLARRFAPMRCVPLGDGHRLDWNGKRWSARTGTQQLSADGGLEAVRP